MHLRSIYEKKMRRQLAQLKAEIDELKNKAAQVETSLQLEYFTLVEELQGEFELANQKLGLMTQAGEEGWEEFKTELELIWDSTRELIKSITSP